ncbi:MAG: YbbR-like domain-containing protein [Planctomycetota bacterium]|jgi:hypothetical protein
MNRAGALFLHDWRRKLLALGIAFLIWSWVEGQIGIDQEIPLTLVTMGAEVRTPNDFELLIDTPDGWILTQPAPGEPVRIKLHGSTSEISDFRAQQCAASIRVRLDADPNQDLIDFPVTPKDLDWMRPRDAAYLLAGVNGAQQLQKLTFERVTESVVVLSPREVKVIGSPSEAHVARVEEMVFEPSQVTLTGPKFAMDQLAAKIDAAHTAAGALESSALLTPLHVDSQSRSDIRPSLALASDLLDFGIRMEPARVRVVLPIRLRAPASLNWLPDAADLKILPADDAASNGPWTVEPWVPTEWIAEMPDVDADLDLNQQWVQEHVALMLPMHTLTADALDRESLRIEARLFGLDPDDLLFYQQHLVIRPLVPDSATVTVTRNP